jgi:pyridoxine 5'-phosphate synthase PdxJ
MAEAFNISGKAYTREELIEICRKIDEAAVSGTPEEYSKLVTAHGYDVAVLLHRILTQENP